MTAICKTTVGSVNSRKNTGKKKYRTIWKKSAFFFFPFCNSEERSQCREINWEKTNTMTGAGYPLTKHNNK